MRTLQDYRNIYREIAQSLGYRGDSVELLVQLLSNATYIEEVENIAYMEEASLERATLMNSKIQHCADLMYSVFRGSCPRVLISIKPTKYQTLVPYQEIITSSNFKVYFLGWMLAGTDDDKEPGIEKGMNYGPCTLNPLLPNVYYIYGFISGENPVVKEHTISSENPYYFDIPETGLSNDMYLEVAKASKEGGLDNYEGWSVSRNFSDHILESSIYDLTLPGFGSRLYFPGLLEESDKLRATYYKLAYLSNYQENELKKIALKGTTGVDFSEDYLAAKDIDSVYAKNLIIIPETPREDLQTIHYNASKNRYISSMVRSNSDMGSLLEEFKPDKVRASGTECVYGHDMVTIYYIPRSNSNPLTSDEIQEFVQSRKAYYITTNIQVEKAPEIRVVLSINLELYQSTDSIESEVSEILTPYMSKFGINLQEGEIIDEIESTLSKLPEVRIVRKTAVEYLDYDKSESPEKMFSDSRTPYYYNIEFVLNTTITK